MKRTISLSLLCLFSYGYSFAQDTLKNGRELTLSAAIQQAIANYPLLKSKGYEVEAARKNIDLDKNTLVPSLDVAYQANLATANNITGQFYPTDMIPMTGPVFSSNNYTPAFGTAASLLLNWQPWTFGWRTAKINTSKAEVTSKTADSENEIFKHTIQVMSQYLDVLLASKLLEVFEKNIDRTSFDLKQARILSVSGLRPGVDTALFLAELSKAKIDLLNARKALQTQKVALSQLLVRDTAFTLVDTGFFMRLPAPGAGAAASTVQHPALKFSQSQLDLSRSKEDLLKKYWLPKLNIWGSGFARGSGVYPDGTIKAADGWGFSRYNYGLGFQLAFPILKYPEVRLQRQQQRFTSQSLEELVKETNLQLSKQQTISEVTLQYAREAAKETPVQCQAVDYAFQALLKRYNAGLVNFADLIQAQYSLVRTETDLQKSYWEVWKALLFKTAVTGDVNIFLNAAK